MPILPLLVASSLMPTSKDFGTAGQLSYSLSFKCDREWHANKPIVCIKLIQRNTSGEYLSQHQKLCNEVFLQERNVSFRVSFDAEDTSYTEFSFLQHVELHATANIQPIGPSLRSQSQGCPHPSKTVADRSKLF